MFQRPKADPGEDADDDGDASDVDDYDIGANDAHSDEEFEAGEIEVENETSIVQGECLQKEMSSSNEIDHLQKSVMQIEEA